MTCSLALAFVVVLALGIATAHAAGSRAGATRAAKRHTIALLGPMRLERHKHGVARDVRDGTICHCLLGLFSLARGRSVRLRHTRLTGLGSEYCG